MRILLIDHHDSYTYNLYHLFVNAAPGIQVNIIYHDDPNYYTGEGSILENTLIQFLKTFDAFVLSPGPGHPTCESDVGISPFVIRYAKLNAVPLLGICLGHQCIATAFGYKVDLAKNPSHGIIDSVILDPSLSDKNVLFVDFPPTFKATRYHSLCVIPPSPDTCAKPSELHFTAFSQRDNTIMALQHVSLPVYGVQFHPESITTQFGSYLVQNFLNSCRHAYASPCDLAPLPIASRANSLCTVKLPCQTIRIRVSRFLQGENVFPSLARHLSTFCESFVWFDTCANVKESVHSRHRFSILAPFTPLDGENFSLALLDSLEFPQYNIDSSYPESCRFRGGYLMVLPYELYHETLVQKSEAIKSLSPIIGIISDWFLFDHHTNNMYICQQARDERPGDSINLLHIYETLSSACQVIKKCSMTKLSPIIAFEDYERMFNECQDNIRRGESYELCLTTQFHAVFTGTPLDYYCYQRTRHSTCLSAYLHTKDFKICCFSPEEFLLIQRASRFVSSYHVDTTVNEEPLNLHHNNTLKEDNHKIAVLDQNNEFGAKNCNENVGMGKAKSDINDTLHVVENQSNTFSASAPVYREDHIQYDGQHHLVAQMRPIKGTSRRYPLDKELDEKSRMHLLHTEKEIAENLMITDLIRNDLGRISIPGSVRVPVLFGVDTFTTCHQLVSTIEADLPASTPFSSIIKATFPPGSMTGAPKERSVKILEKIENYQARNYYSGTLGFISNHNECHFNIIIRSAVFTEAASRPNARQCESKSDELETEKVYNMSVGAGGAITYLSKVKEEWDEILLKVQRLSMD